MLFVSTLPLVLINCSIAISFSSISISLSILIVSFVMLPPIRLVVDVGY